MDNPINKLDDSNKKDRPPLYFDLYSKGYTLRAIANFYDRSLNTIKAYIRQHPDYQDPGSGNYSTSTNSYKSRLTVKNKNLISKNAFTKQVTFWIPTEIYDRITSLKGNNKEHYKEAIAQYFDIPKKQRSLASRLSNKNIDKRISFLCPIELVNLLDEDLSITRNSQFVGALECYLQDKK